MIVTIAENKNNTDVQDSEMQAMMEAGVHIGHSKNKRHPSMESYIWTVRGGVSIIDLIRTKEKLAAAVEFLKSVAAQGNAVLFVGTRPASRGIIIDMARILGMPYVTERWIGGTLTNFKVITKRIEMLADLEARKAGGELEKYTKKERIGFEKEIARLKTDFGGLRSMNRLPAAVFVTNVPHEFIAVREACRMKIPVVALVDTNADPKLISFPIPSNDDAQPALRYMLKRIEDAIQAGRADAKSNKGIKGGTEAEAVHDSN